MFKINLKIAIRNLWKNKGYSAISIGGLAIGLAGFMVILLYANQELSYEKWNPEHKRVYRVTQYYATKGISPATYPLSPYLLGNVMKEKIPEIEAATHIQSGDTKLFDIQNNKTYVKDVISVDSTFFGLFPYKMIWGNPSTALNTPEGIVLTKQTSEKLFGNNNPIGKSIRIDDKYNYTVTGVCEKEGETHFDFNAIIKFRNVDTYWQDFNYYTYVLLNKGSSPEKLQQKITAVYRQIPDIAEEIKSGADYRISLFPVSDIHLFSHTPFEINENGDPEILSIIVLLAAMILVIACINFTNLTIVKSIKRAKEVGMRKVLGSSKQKLVYQFLFEIFLQCLIALGLSMVILELSLPFFNQSFDLNLSLLKGYNHAGILLQIIIAVIMMAVVSGIYPAIYLSSFQPARVLKGNFAKSTRGSVIRSVLIVFQFCVSVLFIIGLVIVLKQLNYMRNKDIGFHPEQVMVIQMHSGTTLRNFSVVKDRLSALPNVQSVSYANFLPGDQVIQTITRDFKDKTVKLGMVRVGYDFFSTLGIQLVKGRNFSLQYPSDSNAIILNQTAAKSYGLENGIGSNFFNGKKIIGIVKDFNQRGVDEEISPMGFWIYDRTSGMPNKMLVRIKAENVNKTIDQVKAVWSSIEPDFPMTYSFLDTDFSKLMLKYDRMGKLFFIFTIIIMLIALMGLFALAAFIAEQRTREIGIRKVLGASDNAILRMLNKNFLIIILIANTVAWPVGYILAKQWLAGFAYRIDVSILPFIAATGFSVLITILTVSTQAWRVIKANPINALKYE